MEFKKCLTCGLGFKPWSKKTKFCSLFCFHEYPRKEERRTGLKKCLSCGEIKPISTFYKRTDNIVHKGYRSSCKKCEIGFAGKWSKNNNEKIIERRHKKLSTPEGQIKMYKRSAIKKWGKDGFELTLEFFKKNLKKPCYYCGQTKTDAFLMGIDRIDSNKFYTEDNCVPCCTKCNLSKFNYSTKDFINHAIKIADYQRRKNGV